MSINPTKLAGKVALVTGGTSGIGLATAKRFAAEGAFVYITGRRKPELDAAVAEIGANVTGLQSDATKLDDLDQLFTAIKAGQGRLDILFANAGGGEFVPFGEYTEEHFDRTFNLNVKGVAFTVQKALPLLGEGSSVIINGSISGSIGQPNFSVYAATKAAVRSFARTWSVDLKGRGIRVNVLSPGVIPTPAHERLGIGQEAHDAFAEQIPLGRVGTPDEVAKVASFLGSDDSSYVTGIELFVDGGIAQI